MPEEELKLEDTNMAGHGGAEHRDMKKKAAEGEAAWVGCGADKGVEIWRIEKFKVKHWPKDRYGEFFGGDSYIILHTKIDDEGKKSYDVYFWLGGETTQDEAGTAAYKTVELDDLLGDEPVQHREVQGNESKGFLDLFPKMTVLAGGVETGFTHVTAKEYTPRLMHVTGFGKKIQVYEKPIAHDSLNDSDVFVLDAGLKLFQFNGSKSSAWEKRKGGAIMDGLKAKRMGKVKDSYTIDGLSDVGSPLIEEFWTFFGGKPESIKEEEPVPEAPKGEVSLHQVSDASGSMKSTEVGRGKLDRSMLVSDDVMILDAVGSVFIWLGKGSNAAEKRESMVYATDYITANGRDWKTPVTRVREGKEPAEFWAAFGGDCGGGRATEFASWKSGGR
jgi:gelsolin